PGPPHPGRSRGEGPPDVPFRRGPPARLVVVLRRGAGYEDDAGRAGPRRLSTRRVAAARPVAAVPARRRGPRRLSGPAPRHVEPRPDPDRRAVPASPLSFLDGVGGAGRGRPARRLRARGRGLRRPLPAGLGRRVPGRPSPSPHVLQPVGGRPDERSAVPDRGGRLGTGPAASGRVAAGAGPARDLLRRLQRHAAEVGDPLQRAALRAPPRRLRAAGGGGAPAAPHRRGLPGLADRGAARRAHRLLDLHLLREQGAARSTGGRAGDAGAVLAQWRRLARAAAMKRLMADLAVAALALVLVLAALEAVARRAQAARGGGREDNPLPLYTEADPLLGWRKKPGARATYRRREYTVEVAINAQGLRDRERRETVEAGSFRILALGDSFVEGYAVPLEATLTQVAESH